MCLILQPRGKLKYSLLEGGLSPAPPSSMLDGSADGVSPEGRAFFSQRMFANIELGGDGGADDERRHCKHLWEELYLSFPCGC